MNPTAQCCFLSCNIIHTQTEDVYLEHKVWYLILPILVEQDRILPSTSKSTQKIKPHAPVV